jgi:hypothetical protein
VRARQKSGRSGRMTCSTCRKDGAIPAAESRAKFGTWNFELNFSFTTRRGFSEHARVALGVEQLTLNQRVPGSSPGAPTKQINILAA